MINSKGSIRACSNDWLPILEKPGIPSLWAAFSWAFGLLSKMACLIGEQSSMLTPHVLLEQ